MNNKRYLKIAKIYIAIILISSFGFAGCGKILDAGSSIKKNISKEQIVEQDDDIIVVEKIEEAGSEEDNNSSELSGIDFANAQNEIFSDESKYYAYSMLNDEERLVYTEILSILSTFGKDVKVSSVDTELIDKAFKCVLIDHPELYYISGYSFTKFLRGDNLEKITVTGTYSMSESEAKEAMKRVDAYTDECINGYSGGVDEYNKVKYVYEYLIKNNEYDLTAKNNQNILSVVDERKTVCQGYAKMTQYLLNKMGVFCTLCEGVVKGSEPHVWNIVKINGNYYHVDTTWGDASYNLSSESETNLAVPEVNYDYLCITDDEITETHVIKNEIPVPQCTSMDANYYVMEGLYFTEVNSDQILAAFDKARENNETYVTLKCANANVYAALHTHLIENQNVFDYLAGSTNVNYVEFKEECRISFCL